MMGGARTSIVLAFAVGALGLIAFFATRGGGRPAVVSTVRQVAERGARERVDLEAAEERSPDPLRSEVPRIEQPAPGPPEGSLPAQQNTFKLCLDIDPVLDAELEIMIGAWDHDPADWLRGRTHVRDRRGSLLPAEESDALLGERLTGRQLVWLASMPYDTPFWISITPDNFRAGGLEGFPPLSVAFPPVARGAEPDRPVELVLSPLGGVRGSVSDYKSYHAVVVRNILAGRKAEFDHAGGFLLWPLPTGEVLVDVLLRDDTGTTQVQLTVPVEEGRITELEPVERTRAGVVWSGSVVDELEQPVGGTLSVFRASGDRLARISVDHDTGEFAWRGVSYPRLRLVFDPSNSPGHGPVEAWIELPRDEPLRLVSPRRTPPWVRLFLEPEFAQGDRAAIGFVTWTLEGEGVRRAGYFFFKPGSDFAPMQAWGDGGGEAVWSRRDPVPRSISTGVEAGVVPEGRYTLILHRPESGTVRHTFAVLPDGNTEHHERVPLTEDGGVAVRGDLVLLARDQVQERGDVLVVIGVPGISESDLANSGKWPLSMTDTESLGPGPFELTGMPPGALELAFIDGVSNRVLGARTVNGEAGETVDLGRITLTLP